MNNEKIDKMRKTKLTGLFIALLLILSVNYVSAEIDDTREIISSNELNVIGPGPLPNSLETSKGTLIQMQTVYDDEKNSYTPLITETRVNQDGEIVETEEILVDNGEGNFFTNFFSADNTQEKRQRAIEMFSSIRDSYTEKQQIFDSHKTTTSYDEAKTIESYNTNDFQTSKDQTKVRYTTEVKTHNAAEFNTETKEWELTGESISVSEQVNEVHFQTGEGTDLKTVTFRRSDFSDAEFDQLVSEVQDTTAEHGDDGDASIHTIGGNSYLRFQDKYYGENGEKYTYTDGTGYTYQSSKTYTDQDTINEIRSNTEDGKTYEYKNGELTVTENKRAPSGVQEQLRVANLERHEQRGQELQQQYDAQTDSLFRAKSDYNDAYNEGGEITDYQAQYNTKQAEYKAELQENGESSRANELKAEVAQLEQINDLERDSSVTSDNIKDNEEKQEKYEFFNALAETATQTREIQIEDIAMVLGAVYSLLLKADMEEAILKECIEKYGASDAPPAASIKVTSADYALQSISGYLTHTCVITENNQNRIEYGYTIDNGKAENYTYDIYVNFVDGRRESIFSSQIYAGGKVHQTRVYSNSRPMRNCEIGFIKI